MPIFRWLKENRVQSFILNSIFFSLDVKNLYFLFLVLKNEYIAKSSCLKPVDRSTFVINASITDLIDFCKVFNFLKIYVHRYIQSNIRFINNFINLLNNRFNRLKF